ncbi:GTPase HflX [bioreactor metagenome]|uniref:GTPase HflX n=1 Tax=bioreactor metagenome TaxID=1076179 RepID=A0A645JLW5_9ZZZZ
MVDASYEASEFHIDVTNKVLKEIGAGNKERVLVYNKIDLLENEVLPVTDEEYICISAKRGDNFDRIIEIIKKKLFSDRITTKLLIPYDRGDISSYLCEKAKVISIDYVEEGTAFEVELMEADYNRLKEYDTI